jgi:hypothetical protein
MGKILTMTIQNAAMAEKFAIMHGNETAPPEARAQLRIVGFGANKMEPSCGKTATLVTFKKPIRLSVIIDAVILAGFYAFWRTRAVERAIFEQKFPHRRAGYSPGNGRGKGLVARNSIPLHSR